MAEKFHLGWFADGFRVPAWNQIWSGSSDHDWVRTFYVDMARSLDRAKFDFLLFSDAIGVKEMFDGSYVRPAKYGIANLDAMAIAPILAWETEGLGFFPTVSTSDWNPYLLARLLSSLDHVTDGRMGWNMVTGGNKDAQKNLGQELLPHDERYRKAHEFAEVATKLWNSWEPDAVVRDYENDVYIDGSKLHTIDHKGEFFTSRGPLAAPPTPQHHPVLAQAGASPIGRDFAAKYSDVVIGAAYGGYEGMKAYRDDLHERVVGHGRSPEDIRVFYMVNVVLAASEAEAHERARLKRLSPEVDPITNALMVHMSLHYSIDLFALDLDEPIPPDLTTQGHQAELASLQASGKTLRELMTGASSDNGAINFVGTPTSVADQLEELQEATGADGLMFVSSFITRHDITEVTDGLVPELQRRGLARTEYSSRHFRDNLFSF